MGIDAGIIYTKSLNFFFFLVGVSGYIMILSFVDIRYLNHIIMLVIINGITLALVLLLLV